MNPETILYIVYGIGFVVSMYICGRCGMMEEEGGIENVFGCFFISGLWPAFLIAFCAVPVIVLVLSPLIVGVAHRETIEKRNRLHAPKPNASDLIEPTSWLSSESKEG